MNTQSIKKFIVASLLLVSKLSHGDVGFQDFAVQQAKANPKTQQTNTQNQGTYQSENCPPCPQTPESPATIALPSFTITIQNSQNAQLASFNFPTNSAFTVSKALCSVHIYPPSTHASSGGSFYVVCTLKSLDGSIFQKEIFPNSTSPQALNWSTMPSTISIVTSSTTIATSTFLPASFSSLSSAQQAQVLNGISPISQRFFISQSDTSLTATCDSGTFEAGESITSIPVPTITSNISTTGSPQPIVIEISDGSTSQTFSFTQFFGKKDLANGLSLSLNIFPPSTTPSSGSGSYILIATLKTLDGVIIHKKLLPNTTTAQPILFANFPSSVSISYGTNTTPILITRFVNANITTAGFNRMSPFNLKYLLQLNSSGLNVSML